MNTKRFGVSLQIATVLLGTAFFSMLLIVPWSTEAFQQPVSSFDFLHNQQITLVVWLIAVGIGVVLIRSLTREQFWAVFYSVVAFASIVSTISRVLLYVISGWSLGVIATVSSIALLFAFKRYTSIWLHNAIIILIVGGIAQLVSTQLGPSTALAALIVLTIYDAVSHKMHNVPQQTIRQLLARDAAVSVHIPHRLSAWRKQTGDDSVVLLGAGDMLFPLLFVGSVLWFGGVAAFSIAAAGYVLAGAALPVVTSAFGKRSVPQLLPFTIAALFVYAVLSQLSGV